ncbi:MAG TPA: multicopper oxidase domain-containing protein [Chthoniobacterales bacterium]|nr:multicopper oxidase domain-containing protein [Chthoniobacterales bacterium]
MREQEDKRFSRRQFLLTSGLAGGGLMLPSPAAAQNSMQMPMASATATPPVKTGPAELNLRIGPVLVDVTKDKTISTIGYNAQVPGPLIRLREGKQVSVQIINGSYDQEVFLATHEFDPFYSTGEMEEEEGKPEDPALEAEVKADKTQKSNGWEIGYRTFTMNGRCLGYGDPIRAKEGERVMFRILNASATETIQLALPGHEFYVVALDGNPIPRPNKVRVLQLGSAERVDAIVEMKNPGVWILGTPMDEDRNRGMGIVVEYAGRKGKPQWRPSGKSDWNYLLFGESKLAIVTRRSNSHGDWENQRR